MKFFFMDEMKNDGPMGQMSRFKSIIHDLDSFEIKGRGVIDEMVTHLPIIHIFL